jgi:glycosyltransferase involved in cell wall biosynthesis
MKIAFINMPWSPAVLPLPFVESSGNWNVSIAQRLTQHEILIYSRRDQGLSRVENYGHVQFRRQGLWLDYAVIMPLVMRFQKRSPIVSRFYYGSYIRQIAQDLRRQNCDVVHVPSFPQFVAAIRKANPRLKIVLHCHEEWLAHFDRAQMEAYIRQADLILGCSEYLVDRFRTRFPAEAERFQVMYPGIDEAMFQKRRALQDTRKGSQRAASPRQLLFVGRISPEKGVHVLLEAFAQVLAQYPDVELNIVGDDMPMPPEFLLSINNQPQIQELVRFCDAHYGSTLRDNLSPEVADRVHWRGKMLNARVIEILSQTDILITPSLYESFGTVVVEAMAAGVPVVASAVGGMKETMIPQETGLLVEADNADQLAAAILTLLRDETACQKMGQVGRRVSQRFTWDRIVGALLQQYERIVGQ